MSLPDAPVRPPSPRALAAELLLYAAIALVAVSAALPTGRVVGDGVDLYGTFWFYWWIDWCIRHGVDPSFTDMMFFPLGKDIFAHTGNNFVDAVLSVPLQAIFGFPDYQPWWVALLLFGNALTFRPLAADLFRTGAARVSATVLWLLCPYILFECMTGRFTQALLWFVPLAVHHFLHIGGVGPDARLPGAAPHQPRWRDPVLAGLYTGLAAWTYWFMGHFLALFFLSLALVDLLRRSGRGRRLMGQVLAGFVSLVVVSPAVVAMARHAGDGAVPGLMAASSGTDSPAQLANNVSQHLHGYWLMETQGQPMFGYLVWSVGLGLALLLARDRLRWGLTLAVCMAFALGPRVQIGEGIDMPHYLWAWRNLPFFDRLWFPVRLLSVAMLAATVLLGMMVDRLEGWRQQRLPRLPAALLPGVLLGLHMVEQNRVLAFPLLSRDLTPPQIYEVIGAEGGGLIELPIGMSRVSVAFQPVHEQPTFGGMAENAPIFYAEGFQKRLGEPFISYLRRVTRDPDKDYELDRESMARFQSEGFRWIVLDRQLVDSEISRGSFARRMPPSVVDRAPFYVEKNLSERLGPPVMAEERYLVWDLQGGARVPEELVPDAADLSERSWPKSEMPGYEARLREGGRLQGELGEPTGPDAPGERPRRKPEPR